MSETTVTVVGLVPAQAPAPVARRTAVEDGDGPPRRHDLRPAAAACAVLLVAAARLLLAGADVVLPVPAQQVLDALAGAGVPALAALAAVVALAGLLRPPAAVSPGGAALAAALALVALRAARDPALTDLPATVAVGSALLLTCLAASGVRNPRVEERVVQRRLDRTVVLLLAAALASVLLPVALGHLVAGPPTDVRPPFAAVWPTGAAPLYFGVGAGLLTALGGVALLRPPWTGRGGRVLLGAVAAAGGAGLVAGLPSLLPDVLLEEQRTRAGAAFVVGHTGYGEITGDQVLLRSGPGTAFPAVGATAYGERVGIVCTGLGEPVGPNRNRLWNRTSAGWVADHYVLTGTTAAVAPGCGGSAGEPQAGAGTTAPASGPFAVLPHRAAVTTHAAPGGRAVGRLEQGALVRVACVQRGPLATGSAGRSDEWLRLVDGRFLPRAVLAGGAAPGAQPRC